jgi:hypothetical protein
MMRSTWQAPSSDIADYDVRDQMGMNERERNKKLLLAAMKCCHPVQRNAATDGNFVALLSCHPVQNYAATRCNGNVVLPLAAFPMHYYPATDTMKFCRPVQSNLPT